MGYRPLNLCPLIRGTSLVGSFSALCCHHSYRFATFTVIGLPSANSCGQTPMTLGVGMFVGPCLNHNSPFCLFGAELSLSSFVRKTPSTAIIYHYRTFCLTKLRAEN